MYCSNCGHNNPNGAVFCEKCGAKITAAGNNGANQTGQAPGYRKIDHLLKENPSFKNHNAEKLSKTGYTLMVICYIAAAVILMVGIIASLSVSANKKGVDGEAFLSTFGPFLLIVIIFVLIAVIIPRCLIALSDIEKNTEKIVLELETIRGEKHADSTPQNPEKQ